MAIYHLNVRGISPARGSSAVRSAAYQSGERLRDAKTGELCDYARKERLSAIGIELPDGAPAWAADRQRLWDEATRAHRGGNGLVARRIVVALPRELDPDLAEAAVRELAAEFVRNGRAVDWAIHELGGDNPHAHLLITALPIGPDGFEQPKTQKSRKMYLCRNADGDECELDAASFKRRKADGWAKLYRYRVEGDEVRLTKGEAEARGLTNGDRASKSPVARMVRLDGEGSLDAERANLVALRKSWAEVANARLAEQAARDHTDPVTIDHRSNAERGIDAAPTVHEGYAVTAMERRAAEEARQGRQEAAGTRHGDEGAPEATQAVGEAQSAPDAAVAPVTDRRAENVAIRARNSRTMSLHEEPKAHCARLAEETDRDRDIDDRHTVLYDCVVALGEGVS